MTEKGAQNEPRAPNVNNILGTLNSLEERHINLLNDMRGHVSSYEAAPEPLIPDPEPRPVNSFSNFQAEKHQIMVTNETPKPEKSEKPPESTLNKQIVKVRKIISAVLFYGFLFCLIGGAFLISQGEKKPVFGYSFMNVLTWSMESEIPQGSMVAVKQVDLNTIKVGDDITYMKDSVTSVTHRVIGITENYENSGARGFETQGTENDTPDFEIVPSVNVVGVVKFHIPKLGHWLQWLREHLFIAFGFTAGFLLLIALLKGALSKPEPEDV